MRSWRGLLWMGTCTWNTDSDSSQEDFLFLFFLNWWSSSMEQGGNADFNNVTTRLPESNHNAGRIQITRTLFNTGPDFGCHYPDNVPGYRDYILMQCLLADLYMCFNAVYVCTYVLFGALWVDLQAHHLDWDVLSAHLWHGGACKGVFCHCVNLFLLTPFSSLLPFLCD